MDISNKEQQDSDAAAISNEASKLKVADNDMFVGWNPPPIEPNQKKNKGVPRLSHKKSKTGCQRCRARRVKVPFPSLSHLSET
jgi:hypothetical protein